MLRQTFGVFPSHIMRAIFFVAMIFPSQPSSAETLPTKGSFEGYFHRDRWGNGHFDFFVVDATLHQKLGKYDGRLIQVHVTRGEQPINPGPSYMQSIDRIDELPQPPFQIALRSRPEQIVAGQPFQLIVTVKNTASTPTWLYPTIAFSEVRLADPVSKPLTPELACRAEMGDASEFNGNANLQYGYGGETLLPRGASYVWVATFPKGIAAGEAEWSVVLGYALTDNPETPHVWRKQGTARVWREVTIQPAKPGSIHPRLEKHLFADEVRISTLTAGWQTLEFRLRLERNQKVRVPTTVNAKGQIDAEKFAHRARLEAFAADGTSIELNARRLPERETPQGSSQLVEIPEGGVSIAAKFQPRSPEKSVITRLVLKVTTDRGVESVELPIPRQPP